MDNWGYKFTCEVCGNSFKSKNIHVRYCPDCINNRLDEKLGLIKRWLNASMCISCGEINPFFLLYNEGHHILGRGKEKNNIIVPICANCHELTKPRSRQSFFLFTYRTFPMKTKFSIDNSKIYIDIK